MQAGVHIGHAAPLLHYSNLPFVYGTRNGITVMHLEHTLAELRRASNVVREVAANKGLIVFVGTRTGTGRVVEKAARQAGSYWVTRRWVAGTITNAASVLPATNWPIPKPDLLVLANLPENSIALAEALAANIPTIGLVDSDCNCGSVSYPIHANDDSVQSVELILGVLAKSANN